MPRSTPEPYIVRSVVHASQILGAFQSSAEVLRLRDVVQRTGFGKGMCFRLLHTLHHCGLLEKVDASRYRLISEIRRRKRYRLGYAGQGQDTSFSHEVHASLLRAAEPEDVELIVVNNRYQPKVALRNAEHLVRERVDLVIEFQTDESVAPAIASKYLEANIPLIAIDIPHPGATYFGANNYQAGLLAGRHLGQWARTRWNGQVEEVLLLELARAGSLVHARMRDVLAELREPRTPLIASVGFFPERYGDGLIRLALDILAHRRTPPALFIRHQLITTENVDHSYPNDALLGHLGPARHG